MPKITGKSTLSPGRVRAAMTIYVEVIPVRDDTDAMDVAHEVGRLLSKMTHAERIERGHVSDRRWHLTDPMAQCSVPNYDCLGLLTAQEAADVIGVTANTVRRMVARGSLEADKSRRQLMVPFMAALSARDERESTHAEEMD